MNWLVYSKELYRVFCFYCKLFDTSCRINRLANEDFNDWKHIYERLKEHESSGAHMSFMSKWIDLQIRFKKNIKINKHLQELIINEKGIGRMSYLG